MRKRFYTVMPGVHSLALIDPMEIVKATACRERAEAQAEVVAAVDIREDDVWLGPSEGGPVPERQTMALLSFLPEGAQEIFGLFEDAILRERRLPGSDYARMSEATGWDMDDFDCRANLRCLVARRLGYSGCYVDDDCAEVRIHPDCIPVLRNPDGEMSGDEDDEDRSDW